MLYFVGLGLFDEKDVSLKGLEVIKQADEVYVEFYTSRLMGSDQEKMEALYGRELTVLSREEVEQNPWWLERAKDKDVVFLTGGDTMVSTTHVDLRLRAHRLGIPTRLIHGSSIVSAICGLSGLQNYRFGKAATVPHPYTSSRGNTIISESPYDAIIKNIEQDLHTLVFLDIDKDKGYMTVPEAVNLLLAVDSRRDGMLSERIGVGIARAGSPAPVVKADFLPQLKEYDFGEPLQILVIPASLHFLESEALVELASAPEEVLEIDE
ncbi:diphthine synthase [Methanohalophilus levihalophilus]|uniref:diphthine synthase n=1 Tax=Methanohalophilus levihalophilus TaxID=1431282 RepID=UPI001AE3B9B0|nr:diphthine synthase [Methanohalophilus levihalophilus]MBP2031165.1 diphthine synthase [Methanohalophilus levihalophilus]